jgi:hypothetical protein
LSLILSIFISPPLLCAFTRWQTYITAYIILLYTKKEKLYLHDFAFLRLENVDNFYSLVKVCFIPVIQQGRNQFQCFQYVGASGYVSVHAFQMMLQLSLYAAVPVALVYGITEASLSRLGQKIPDSRYGFLH